MAVKSSDRHSTWAPYRLLTEYHLQEISSGNHYIVWHGQVNVFFAFVVMEPKRCGAFFIFQSRVNQISDSVLPDGVTDGRRGYLLDDVTRVVLLKLLQERSDVFVDV